MRVEERSVEGVLKTEESKVDKRVVMFGISVAFGEELDRVAFEEDKPVAQIVREALADRIGWDLENEPSGARKSKYASPAEKAEAVKARAKAKRELTNTLMDMLKKGEIKLGE